MSIYTEGNKDDVKEAVASLDKFTKNWCMNCKETEEKNDLVFRCGACFFKQDGLCLIKKFKVMMIKMLNKVERMDEHNRI